MTGKDNYIKSLMLVIGLFSITLPGVARADIPIKVSTTPATIEMGTQFNGVELQVEGSVPAGSSVIVRFTGEPSDLHLRQKGKIFNLLWMNVGTVELKNVPKVCIISTSESFEKMGQAAYPYSLAGLVSDVEVEKDQGAQEIDVEKELLLLKKREGLYSEAEQGITLDPEKDGSVNYSAMLSIPPALSPGTYLIETVAVRDGEEVARISSSVQAMMVGFPKWLSQLAFHKSLLYGVMATIIALVSGLIIGLVFQSKGAH